MPNKESPPDADTASGDVWLGAVLVGLAVIVIGLAQSIRALGLGDNYDPGSKAFPVGLAIILAIGGLIEVWQGRRNRSVRHSASSETTPPSGRTKTAALLLLGFGVYIGALPWLGFTLATLIMTNAMMIWLGNPWPRSIIGSIVLVGLVYTLFVVGFKVPLPGGVLNLPF